MRDKQQRRLCYRLAQWLICRLTHAERQVLYGWLGRGLNIEKDGQLDGRPKEGN